MGKKSVSINSKIDNAAKSFRGYLKSVVGEDVFGAIEEIASKTEIFIFSGLIRNYFLGVNEARDIDIVLKDRIDIERFFPQQRFLRNSFGGYKIHFEKVEMDIWCLKDTWAYQYQKVFDFYYTVGIPYTAFFNLSSIVFDYSKRKFCYTNEFVDFLKKRELDVVYMPNPNYDLCVINTLYYQKKFKLAISRRLSRLIIDLHRRNGHDYGEVQVRHFGTVEFLDKEIDDFVAKLEAACTAHLRRSVSLPASTGTVLSNP